MVSIIIGIVLLLMVLVDYKIMQPKRQECGFLWRVFAVIFGILNLILGIWF